MERCSSRRPRWRQFRLRTAVFIGLGIVLAIGYFGSLVFREPHSNQQTLPTPYIGTNDDIFYEPSEEFYRALEAARVRQFGGEKKS